METACLMIYGLYISGKKYSFKINMNMTQNYTLTYTIDAAFSIIIIFDKK